MSMGMSQIEHVWCTFGALLVHFFQKVHQKCTIGGALLVHFWCTFEKNTVK